MLNPMQFLKTRDAVTIMFVALFLPYIFVHIWWLRLACIAVLSLALVYEIIRQVIHADLMFRDDRLWNPFAKKIFIWFARVLFIVLLPMLIYFGIIIPSKDAISGIMNSGPIVKTIEVLHDDDETGFTQFVIQNLIIDGENKRLPLYFPLLRNGDKYQITYFPNSYLIYDAISVE